MVAWRSILIRFLLFAGVSFAFQPIVHAGDLFFLSRLQRERPDTCTDPSVEQLAKEIDWLEAQIEIYGTIVPKQPDVWGEARLTRHRQEVDREMASELDGFRETLNASIRRSDQSFLGTALTLSAALEPGAQQPSAATVTNTLELVDVPEGAIVRTKPGELPQPKVTTSLGPNAQAITGVSLEPTVVLQQKFRYLQLLNELRRINEGDDTADAPGYALNLVRIPVSVFTGKKTRSGYGAEITITASPHLSDQLLPTTFRSLVINDVVDILALPGRKMLDHPEIVCYLECLLRQNLEVLKRQRHRVQRGDDQKTDQKIATAARNLERMGVLDFAGVLVTDRSTHPHLPFPPAHMVDVFGPGDVFAPIVLDGQTMLGRHPVDQNYPHLPDVEAFLRAEANAAYEFLAQPAAAFLWFKYCTPELVRAIRQRRRYVSYLHYDAIGDEIGSADGRGAAIHQIRGDFFNDIVEFFPRAAFTSTTSLAWAIIVDAALLNERLAEDMRRVAIEKDCQQLAVIPEWPDFWAPNPSPEARFAFNEYVRARWPVQVFALDPVTDDQNVADLFSMRREMQWAAAVAVASGNASPSAAFRFVRRLEMDIETIALNSKTAGFVHGPDTFGWRFYPRVQTPPTVNNAQAFVQTLVGGPSSDWLIRRSKLDPGIRELTAVVLMPSFVPHLVFDTRANWFRLTNPKHKEMTLHDVMAISRTWQSVRTAAPSMCNAACYRAEDLAWLAKSVDQIERRLPLQSLLVPIPYENTVGGFELFNSGITDLAPSLSGWYGAPGITISAPVVGCVCASDGKPPCPVQGGLPYEGVEFCACRQCDKTCLGTTLFLVGNHFSGHDTHVVAGGRCVPYQLISRQIMRVTIPPNVNTLPERVNGRIRQVVDVHVATPYGVSNHLLVNAVIPEPTPAVPPALIGYSWQEGSARLRAAVSGQSMSADPLTIVAPPGADTAYKGMVWATVMAETDGGTIPLGHTGRYPVIADSRQANVLVVQDVDYGQCSLAGDLRTLAEKSHNGKYTPTKYIISGYLMLDGAAGMKITDLEVDLEPIESPKPDRLPALPNANQHLPVGPEIPSAAVDGIGRADGHRWQSASLAPRPPVLNRNRAHEPARAPRTATDENTGGGAGPLRQFRR